MQRLLVGCASFFVAFLIFTSGYWWGQSRWAPVNLHGPFTGAPVEAQEPHFVHFWEVWRLVNEHYIDQPIDEEALVDGAIDGMLTVLGDPNTQYLRPEEEQAARDAMAGELQGIGAEVQSVDGDITIVSPLEGSPAEAAGLQPGDILREANGVVLTGLDIAQAAAQVRGPAGSAVLLLVERDGELFEVEIIRDVIRIPSVRGEMLEEGIAYIRLSRFGDNTSEELEELLETLLAEQPAGMILDLRRNPGGGLSAAVEAADQFLDEGLILIERFGDGREVVFESTGEGLAQEIPLVVLVDEGTASAAEVLAGAIQDRARGVLIGQQTFGKGTVQTWYGLSNDGGVRITVARWLTPSNGSVDPDGVTPDYLVERLEDEPLEDVQLEAAINYLLDQ